MIPLLGALGAAAQNGISASSSAQSEATSGAISFGEVNFASKASEYAPVLWIGGALVLAFVARKYFKG